MGKTEVLNGVLDKIRKQYGEGAIMWLGESGQRNVPVIPSGSLALDIALGIGGVPRGRVIEVYGPESSGKTTLALHFIAESQKQDGVAGFIDAEHALDPTYAQAIGVDLDEILLSQPSSGEQALEITEQLVRSGALDIVVVDSVAALVPEAEITGAMGDAQVGLQARLMSQAMRKLTSSVGASKTTVVFINQIRSTISGGPYGPKTTTSGGLALRFYSSMRIEVRRIGSVDETTDDGKQAIGNQTRIRVVKNKLAPPFREAETDIIYGKGIVRSRELLHLGEVYDLVDKRGAWYSYNDERLGQGQANAALFLEDHPEIADEIERRIREQSILGRSKPSDHDTTDADASADNTPNNDDEDLGDDAENVPVAASEDA